eukprot:3280215-Pyramimonas_sp.AAC.2
MATMINEMIGDTNDKDLEELAQDLMEQENDETPEPGLSEVKQPETSPPPPPSTPGANDPAPAPLLDSS